jgi:hypothetical protein
MGLLAEVKTRTVTQKCDIFACPFDGGLPQRNGKIALRYRPLFGKKLFVLENHDRIIIADGGFDQALDVRRLTGYHDLEPGCVNKPGFQGMRMVGCRPQAGTVRTPDHHRNAHLTAEHITDFCCLIGQLIHGASHKIRKMQINERPHTGQGRAQSDTDNARFADRRVNDTTRKIFGDTLKLAEYAGMGGSGPPPE